MECAQRAAGWNVGPRARWLVVFFVVLAGCGGPASRDLSKLFVVDSLYVDPGTRIPYTGPVHRPFVDDPDEIEVKGNLLGGTWDGELIVYHPNGRVRYMGSFVSGERCGPWTENADSVATENTYDELVREIESMGIYPPCEELSSPTDTR